MIDGAGCSRNIEGDDFVGRPAAEAYCNFVAENYHRFGAPGDVGAPCMLSEDEQVEFARLYLASKAEVSALSAAELSDADDALRSRLSQQTQG